MRRFNILISAYACEPERGSEPGVGWNWVNQVAKRGHNVIVITREKNREKIESADFDRSRIWFYYYDLPEPILRLKKLIGVHLYYFLWQLGIVRLAINIITKHKIDGIHHLTFVSLRKPTFLSCFSKPFFYGPVGGGEQAPIKLINELPVRYLLLERLRSLMNIAIKVNPLQQYSFSKAKLIAATTDQSFHFLPRRHRYKNITQTAIGIENIDRKLKRTPCFSEIKLLFVGNFIYWKGIHLAIDVLYHLSSNGHAVSLTLVGKGNFRRCLERKIEKLELQNQVKWIDWVSQNELESVYDSHHLFLFPSLHDSGGMVVLEALARGLPVVCLDLGGPGLLINQGCGFKVDVSKKNYEQIVTELANGVVKLSIEKNRYEKLSRGAVLRAKEFSWEKVVANFYTPLEATLSSE